MSAKKPKEKNQQIQVFARVRPLVKEEGLPGVIEIRNTRELSVKHHSINRSYTFDRVFGPDSQQADVFKWVVEPVVGEVIAGYNCTVMAYGQTGTGKTYTMVGGRGTCSGDPSMGFIPRALSRLFDELNAQNLEYTVRVSYLVVYNEDIFDLLSSVEENVKLKLYDDSLKKGSVIVHGLTECTVCSKIEVYSLLERGSKKRREAATLLNTNSTRAHTVFCVTVHTKENCIDGDDLLRTGKLYLVDLAGSENIKQSGATDIRAREACSINQSLLTLGRCIINLMERSSHIPYRESKLTRLLQDSLGGKTKTSLIATLSPSVCNTDETINTLDYASRAKCITNKPEMNQRLSKTALLHVYTLEIERLQKDLIASRSGSGVCLDPENYANLLKEIDVQREQDAQKNCQIELLQEQKAHVEETVTHLQQTLAELETEMESKEEEISNLKMELRDALYKIGTMSDEIELKEFLVSSHVQTEKTLQENAKNLLQMLDSSTADGEKLHKKLDVLLEINAKNKNTLREKMSEFNGTVNMVEETLIKFHAKAHDIKDCLLQHLVCLQGEQSQCEKLCFHYINEIGGALKTYSCSQQDNNTCTLKSLEQHLTKAQEQIDKNENDACAITTKHNEIVTLNLKSLIELVDKQQKLNEQASQSFRSCLDENCSNILSILSAFHKALDSTQTLIIQNEQMNKQTLAAINKSILDHGTKQNEIQKECEAKLSAVLKTLNILQSLIYANFTCSQDNNNAIVEQLQDTCNSMSAQTYEIEFVLDKVNQSLDDCRFSINSSKSIFGTQYTNIVNQNMQHFQETKTYLNGIQQNVEDYSTDISTYVKSLATSSRQILESEKTSIEDYTKARNEQLLHLEKTTADSTIKFSSKSIENFQDSTKLIGEMNKKLVECKKLHALNESHFRTELEKSKENIKNIFTCDLKEYKEMGNTPTKKSYNYSRTIASTKSHEEVYSEYKKQKRPMRRSNSIPNKKNQANETFTDENKNLNTE